LLPGLIDFHVHLWALDGTGLRRSQAELIAEMTGGRSWPRLCCNGPLITGPDGHPAFLGSPVAMQMMTRRGSSEEEARAQVAEAVGDAT